MNVINKTASLLILASGRSFKQTIRIDEGQPVERVDIFMFYPVARL
jgi:hypothetical protein